MKISACKEFHNAGEISWENPYWKHPDHAIFTTVMIIQYVPPAKIKEMTRNKINNQC